MKSYKWIIIFAVLGSLIISCKKRFDSSFKYKELVGTWQWVRSDGGITTMHLTPASTGKNIDLKITGDHRYYYIINDTLMPPGSFSIKSEKSIYDHKNRPVIFFSNNQRMMVQRLDTDTLELSDNAYDGVGVLYIRKKGS